MKSYASIVAPIPELIATFRACGVPPPASAAGLVGVSVTFVLSHRPRRLQLYVDCQQWLGVDHGGAWGVDCQQSAGDVDEDGSGATQSMRCRMSSGRSMMLPAAPCMCSMTISRARV